MGVEWPVVKVQSIVPVPWGQDDLGHRGGPG